MCGLSLWQLELMRTLVIWPSYSSEYKLSDSWIKLTIARDSTPSHWSAPLSQVPLFVKRWHSETLALPHSARPQLFSMTLSRRQSKCHLGDLHMTKSCCQLKTQPWPLQTTASVCRPRENAHEKISHSEADAFLITANISSRWPTSTVPVKQRFHLK